MLCIDDFNQQINNVTCQNFAKCKIDFNYYSISSELYKIFETK
jgi:hypothetical protein